MLLSVQTLQDKLSRAAKQSLDRKFGALYDKQKVKEVIGRRYGRTLEEMIEELNPVLRGWSNYHRRTGAERRHLRKLNGFVRERLRIFLKRKYSDPTRGTRRLLGNRLVRLGLFQLA
jgi:hypothetical protein